MADIIVAHIVLTISLKCGTVQILPAPYRLVLIGAILQLYTTWRW